MADVRAGDDGGIAGRDGNVASLPDRIVLITGVSRGIGREFVAQLLAEGVWFVIGTCRSTEDIETVTSELAACSERLRLIQLDVTDDSSLSACKEAVEHVLASRDHVSSGARLRLLVNNAASFDKKEKYLPLVTRAGMASAFDVNCTSPLLLAQALSPLLRSKDSARPAIIANISSELGSLTTARPFWYSYKMSKCALNMATKLLAGELGTGNCITVSLHPGHVKTRMGGDRAPVTPGEAVSGMLKVLATLTAERSGSFLDWRGDTLSF